MRQPQHQRVLRLQQAPQRLNLHQPVPRLQQAQAPQLQQAPQRLNLHQPVLQLQQAHQLLSQRQQVRQLQQVHQFQIQQTIRTHKLEMLLDRQVNPKKNCLIQVLSRQLDLCYLEF